MKKIISICLSLIMILSLGVTAFAETRIVVTDENGNTTYLSDFKDTSGHWAHDVILKWAEYELIQGNQGNFMPNSPIKRGDLCLILDRMLGLKSISYNFFYDLPSDKYYTEAVLKCVAAGLINGTSSTTVDPEGYATREQIAAIMCRLLALDSSGWRNVRKFNDDAYIGSWAKDSVYTMRKYGYMNGDNSNNVNPKSNITRAEFVQVMNNIAGSYIPKNDRTGIGSSFKSDFVTNLMTSRSIELVNSTIGRDLIMTENASSLTITNSNVVGRLFVMNRSSIELSKTKVGQLYLKNGKSNITGITSDVAEVYVAQYASESSLDSIPTRLVLEPGVRVRIDGVFYENTSAYNKTYYGIDIKADIAAEQGYVVGGPKINNVTMVQDIDNVVSVTNAYVNSNGSTIVEMGVVWKNQYSNEDYVIPNYQNRDGIYKYWNTKIDDIIKFDVGSVSGTRTYRMYVKDSEGLFAYSQPFTFTSYNYNIKLNVYDNDYPKKIDVELIMQGDNLPDTSNIRVTYGNDETYSENRNEVSLTLYTNQSSEIQIDSSKYRRYTATINVQGSYDSSIQDYVYNPPTHFGYIITFRNNAVINRYPVLSNVVPEGVSPMGNLKTGYANYLTNGSIQIKDNSLTTRYVIPQEAGIVYKISNSNNVGQPTADANGWKRVPAYINIGLGESTYYTCNVSPGTTEGYTCYAAYVKTSNGYWYGDVKYVSNNRFAEEGGYTISSAEMMFVEGDCIVTILADREIDLNSQIILNDNLSYTLNTLTCKKYKNYLFVHLPNYAFVNNSSVIVKVKSENNLMSNAYIVNVNNSNKLTLSLGNKTNINNKYRYYLNSNISDSIVITNVTLLNSGYTASFDGRYISVPSEVNVLDTSIKIDFAYYPKSVNAAFNFSTVINLY